MASSSSSLISLSSTFLQKDSPLKKTTTKSPISKFPLTTVLVNPINIKAAMSVSETDIKKSSVPMREIPGDYGLPFIGPIKDRQDFFYNEGQNNFFKNRIQKYNSTVFRANMPPGPFISSNPNVIVLLDGKSFPILFDVSKVEKRDLFVGTYMPSLELTGGYRILSYLDPSEPKHDQLKRFLFFLLKSRSSHFIPEFHSSYTKLLETLEKELAKNGKAPFGDASDQTAFNYLAKAFYGVNPSETKLGTDAPSIITKWTALQLGPILTIGLPRLIEEPLLHTFLLPPALVKKDYQRLYEFFYESSSGQVLDEAVRLGVSKEEAVHNLIFATCFNSFGGMKILFPSMLGYIGEAGANLHAKLAEEIRSVVKSNGGKVTMAGLEQMQLMKSVVYETLRIDPPVPFQYAKAKSDFVIENHENAFEVKEGEMLFGYQPFATKDSKIFDRAEEFVGDRFLGEGEKLLKHVLWSNGPETEQTNVGNKQCAGKDFVVLFSRLLVVELFLRYDTFDVQVERGAAGSAVTFTSFKKATF